MAAELDLTGVYRQMLRIREFEERVKATFTEHPGVIRGHTHLADGAEASIAGEPRPEAGGPFWAAADRAMASPAWRYREIATDHMIPSNRPGELARMLLELT